MEPVLEVRNLKKVFDQEKQKAFAAVEHVSFSLYPGEILGLVGESGSGKSTVAKLVTRLTDVTEGEIILDGQDITHLKGAPLRRAYSKLQMVFQTPAGSFDPRKTLGSGIGESLKNKGLSKKVIRERVVQLLAKCGLGAEFADRYPHQVSGGECQRAAIARALASDPKVIVCDEATSSLDVTVQKQVTDLLQSLRREKKLAYLFICHNLALVQQICDRVLILHEGKVVEQGTPDEVIRRPQSEYTSILIDSIGGTV